MIASESKWFLIYFSKISFCRIIVEPIVRLRYGSMNFEYVTFDYLFNEIFRFRKVLDEKSDF